MRLSCVVPGQDTPSALTEAQGDWIGCPGGAKMPSVVGGNPRSCRVATPPPGPSLVSCRPRAARLEPRPLGEPWSLLFLRLQFTFPRLCVVLQLSHPQGMLTPLPVQLRKQKHPKKDLQGSWGARVCSRCPRPHARLPALPRQ